MATARWKGPSWAAACSAAVRRAGPRPARRPHETRSARRLGGRIPPLGTRNPLSGRLRATLRRLAVPAVALLVSPVRGTGRRLLRDAEQPVVHERDHEGDERGDQGARDDRAQPVAQHMRQGGKDEAQQEFHDDLNDDNQNQRAEHGPAMTTNQLAAPRERRQHPGSLNDYDRHDHGPDRHQVKARSDDQPKTDPDPEAGQDGSPYDGPERWRNGGYGLADGQVRPAIPHILYRLNQRRLQHIACDKDYEKAKYKAEATGQAQQRDDDGSDHVDDEGDRQKMLGEGLVHYPCFAENTRQWVHGRDGTARI